MTFSSICGLADGDYFCFGQAVRAYLSRKFIDSFVFTLPLEGNPLGVPSERLGCLPGPVFLTTFGLQFLYFPAPYDVSCSFSALLLQMWKWKWMLHSPLYSSFLSKSWTLSPYCLDSSLVSLKRFFKVSRPSFSCQQACQLLWEVEISSNCWTQCCHLVGYNLSVRNLELWFILSRNVGIIVLKLFYIYFVHACSVVSNSEQIDPGIDLVGTKIFTVRKKIQSR